MYTCTLVHNFLTGRALYLEYSCPGPSHICCPDEPASLPSYSGLYSQGTASALAEIKVFERVCACERVRHSPRPGAELGIWGLRFGSVVSKSYFQAIFTINMNPISEPIITYNNLTQVKVTWWKMPKMPFFIILKWKIPQVPSSELSEPLHMSINSFMARDVPCRVGYFKLACKFFNAKCNFWHFISEFHWGG